MSEDSRFIKNVPCIKCGSSDAGALYSDGRIHCFSCKANYKEDDMEDSVMDLEKLDIKSSAVNLSEYEDYPVRGFKERLITKPICEFFEVKSEVSSADGKTITAHLYPYHDGKTLSGYKRRELPKNFRVIGKQVGLFGQKHFSTGKRLVITEGEIDCLSVAQAFQDHYRKIYPVVSIPTGAASSDKHVLANRDWIRQFDEVVLMVDQDEVGQMGAEKLAKIIGQDKVKISNYPEKDPNELYVKQGSKAVMDAIWNASSWSPAGLIASSETWDAYKAEIDAEYVPWPPFATELNKMSYGRRLGAITMITSGTGMGKSSFLKEDQYHLLNTTEHKIGVCSLEESLSEAVGGIMALHANKRIGLPDVELAEGEERKLWEETMGDDRFMFLDHQGSVSDNSLTDKIEYMALAGCKYIYLDHITIAVSEVEGDNINQATDKLMSDLLKICKRHNIWLGVVSHLRKTNNNQKSFEEGAVPSDDDLKGSGSLKQIAMQIIAISRSKIEEDPTKRNTSSLWILKDRFTGRTGPAGKYRFIEATGRLQVLDAEDFSEDLISL